MERQLEAIQRQVGELSTGPGGGGGGRPVVKPATKPVTKRRPGPAEAHVAEL